mmetsp:Transcript_19986/g.53412  ORF Transcript_19986/g.53412 Transcript_19986/m.53412 type:complete len:143 (+) Transcript_19986:1444-1872(+)
MFPGRNAFFKAFGKWASSWQKDVRVVFILHVQVLTGDVLRGTLPVYFPLCRAPNSHELCTHLIQALWVSNSSGSTYPKAVCKARTILQKSSTVRHCCDQTSWHFRRGTCHGAAHTPPHPNTEVTSTRRKVQVLWWFRDRASF